MKRLPKWHIIALIILSVLTFPWIISQELFLVVILVLLVAVVILLPAALILDLQQSLKRKQIVSVLYLTIVACIVGMIIWAILSNVWPMLSNYRFVIIVLFVAIMIILPVAIILDFLQSVKKKPIRSVVSLIIVACIEVYIWSMLYAPTYLYAPSYDGHLTGRVDGVVRESMANGVDIKMSDFLDVPSPDGVYILAQQPYVSSSQLECDPLKPVSLEELGVRKSKYWELFEMDTPDLTIILAFNDKGIIDIAFISMRAASTCRLSYPLQCLKMSETALIFDKAKKRNSWQ